MVSVKKAAPGAPNIKVFWDIIYEVIFSVHDITNKFCHVRHVILKDQGLLT